MSLEHAILGFLNYSPMSGYDLKKLFDVSVDHFWSADQGQIYRTLARLVKQGWTEMELIEQKEHPDRKVYHITTVGKDELHRWLTNPLPLKGFHEPELVQLFFSGQLSDEEIRVMLEKRAEKLRSLLAHYEQVPQESANSRNVGLPRDNFFWMLTLESGISSSRAQLQWLESVIRRIQNKEYPVG